MKYYFDLKRKSCLFVLIALSFFFCSQLYAEEGKAEGGKWSLTLLGGVMSDDTLGDAAIFKADYDYSHKFLALALGREVGRWKKDLRFELEGQAMRHSGVQRYWEFDGAIIARWLSFPWDRYVDTSFAVGEGFSIASEKSELEQRLHEESSRFLNYLLFEFTFAHPEYKALSLVTRLHHRSGIRGLINDVHGASNSMAVGLRYEF
jgi:hypothetical protein